MGKNKDKKATNQKQKQNKGIDGPEEENDHDLVGATVVDGKDGETTTTSSSGLKEPNQQRKKKPKNKPGSTNDEDGNDGEKGRNDMGKNHQAKVKSKDKSSEKEVVDNGQDEKNEGNTTQEGEEPKGSDKGDEERENNADDADDQASRRRKRKRKRKRKSDDNDANENDEAQEKERGNDDADDDGDSVDKDPRVIQLERTIFVEGIPYECTENDLRDFFGRNGISADCLVEFRLPVWNDTGRLRGYGHVVFSTIENKQKALTLSGKYLQNRYLSIQPAAAPGSNTSGEGQSDSSPSKTLIIKNLSYEATEEDIAAVMETFGTTVVGGIRIVRDSRTQRSKGFAYVEFQSLESAQAVFGQTKPIVIRGRPCRIDYDHGRMKGSFRASNGRLWQKEYSGLSDQDG